MNEKIKTEDERIKESEDFLFEFEGFLYYTESYQVGINKNEVNRIKEKRIGIHRRSICINPTEFIEILKAYLKNLIK